MVLLVERPGRPLTAKEIAGTLNLSEAHLAKVLQRLAKAGLVRSARGPKGGFTLAKPGDGITLLDVYETIEGKLEPLNCILNSRMCTGDFCIFGLLLSKVSSEVREYLTTRRLSDFTGNLLGGTEVTRAKENSQN